MRSFIPASVAELTSLGVIEPVKPIIWSLSPSSARTCFVNSIPSISGICISVKIKSIEEEGEGEDGDEFEFEFESEFEDEGKGDSKEEVGSVPFKIFKASVPFLADKQE